MNALQLPQAELERQNQELQWARAELETQLGRFAELYELAPVGYLTLGRDGVIRQANLTAARLLGLERAGSPGQRVKQFIAESSRAAFDVFLADVFEHRTKQACDLTLLVERGAPVWVHLEATTAEDGQECRAVLVDTTERERATQALRESEERFRVMADGAPINIWVSDAQGGVCFTNRHFQDSFGVAHGAAEGGGWRSLVHPEDAPAYFETVQRAVTERTPFVREVRIRRADGTWRWLMASAAVRQSATGEFLGHVGMSVDITDRKQVEEAVRGHARELETLINVVPVGLWISEDPLCRTIKGNRAAYECYETAAGENLSSKPSPGEPVPERRFFRGDRELTPDELPMRVAATGNVDVRDAEVEVVLPSGARRTLRGNASPLRDADGRVRGSVAALLDVSERTRREKLLRFRMGLIDFAATHSLQELMRHSLDEIAAVTGSAIGFYHFVEPDEQTLSLQAWSTATMAQFCTAKGEGQHYPVDRAGVWADAVRERRPVIHNDYASLPHRKGLPAGHAALIRELVVTIMREGRVVAAAGVGNKPSAYTEADVETVAFLADVAWQIIAIRRADEALRERVKELRCLYSIAEAIEEGSSLDETLEKAVDLLPPGWSYPEVACARLTIGNGEFKTANFAATEWRLAADMTIDGQRVGGVEVGYLEERPPRFEGPFLKEERELIDAIAERLARVVERTRAQAALRESEARFRTLADNSPDTIIRYDRDLRCVFANLEAARRFGVASHDMIGKRLHELGQPAEAAAAVETLVREVFATGEPRSLERHLGERWFDVKLVPERDGSGVVTSVLNEAREITERKRAEAVLRENEANARRHAEELETLMETVPAGIWVSQDRDLRTVVGNRAAAELMETAADTAVSTGAINTERRWFRGGREVGPQELPMQLAVTTGQDVWDHEAEVVLPSGRRRTLLGNARPLFDEKGQVRGSVAACMDITPLRRAEEVLRDLDRQKNAFISVLSHELRNPLAPIKNSLFILEHVAPGGDQARRAQAVITRQVNQLARLVDDLLDLTRISENKIHLQRERLELNELTLRTVEDHRTVFEKAGIALELEPASAPVFVDADGNRLAQVIGNLLQNAAKFTAAGGHVTVTLRADPDARRATISVADDGAGMSEETLAQLFQPFAQAATTLHRSQGGLGIGLALVKGLVELQGGEVSGASAGLGRGSELIVSLPLDLGGAVATHVPAAAPGPRRRVLIIEDNRDAAETLREVLEIMDHEVVAVAHDGPDGIAKARAFRPEVVLCDIGLPGMSGYDVARAFHADDALKGTFLVALSGYSLPDDVQRASEAGFDRHLAKPASLETLGGLLADLDR